ncbi:MFS transporter [Kitasatospora kifunensis]|uniref:DHA2 family multidrug resistance protein-like MFS transporter n=1 Tax=Kitasatospora kifunensis TaxID=58351 RepID=A0A7W7VYH3_KITKI|nr:MFS transporter [Kitasatospora kifunensis]MBB4927043.1 DHA2 family multidrug resistance protein-like MFS transporter [Kitasatospora kifunensis]
MTGTLDTAGTTTRTCAAHSTAGPDPRRWSGLAVLVLGVLLVVVDATVLVLAIPSITESLAPSSTALLWIGDSYSFVLAGLLVSMGALSDRIGRKRLLLIGAAAFGAASLLAAYAPSPGWLIAARALLGVAGATIMPSTLSLIRALFPDARERARAIGIWGAAATAGAAAGPLVGGVLLEHFWWGSVFLLNLPIIALLLVLGGWLLPESKDPKPGRWDVLSVLCSMTGLIALVYAITEAAAHGVAHWQVPVAAVLGVLGLWLFVRRQLRLANPLLDVRLFADRRFTAAVLGALIAVFGLAGVVFFMSQYLQLVREFSPLKAGLAELPAFIGAAVASVLTARLTRAAGARAALAGGMAVLGLSLGALGLLQQDTSYLLLAVVFLAVGAAEGLVYTLSADLVLTAAPPAKAGAASAVSETAYELGTALGIALFGSVLTAVYPGGVGTPPGVDAATAAKAHESLGAAVAVAKHLPGEAGQALVTAAREAFVRGMGLAAVLGAVLVLLGAGLAWRLLRRI